EALELEGLSSCGVGLDVDTAQADVVGGKLVLIGGLVEEALDRDLFFQADHGVIWSGHPYIRDVGGTAWKNSRIRGLDVSVRTEKRRDSPVEVPSERHLLRGGLRMHVDHDHGSLLAHLPDGPIRLLERAIKWLHVDPSLQVQHSGLPLLAK